MPVPTKDVKVGCYYAAGRRVRKVLKIVTKNGVKRFSTAHADTRLATISAILIGQKSRFLQRLSIAFVPAIMTLIIPKVTPADIGETA